MDSSGVGYDLTAEAYIRQLGQRGVEVVFANSGTDFAPIIEAISRTHGSQAVPRFITVPHENLAMSMAYGYYRASGKIAGVMVHVSVGTANALCGLMNAAKDNVPILLAAGRTPVSETGHIASRNRPIHWGQECFDQGGIVREFVKWDYELRSGQPVQAIVDRALDVAMSEPCGPVYLTLPREVLANPAVQELAGPARDLGAAAPAPSEAAIAQAAQMIAQAKFPLIITSAGGRTTAGFHAMSKLAREFAIPVIQSDAKDLSLPTDHEMDLGFEPSGDLLQRADLVLVVDCAVPWIPKSAAPRDDAKLIHMAPDPLITQYPFVGFRYDLLVAGSVPQGLERLYATLKEVVGDRRQAVEERRAEISELRQALVQRRATVLSEAAHKVPMSNAHIAGCLNALKAKDAICLSELGMPVGLLDLTEPHSLIGSAQAGGLGLGLGAALGAKLAQPEREVIVAVGDGSYMFGNPIPYHFVQKSEGLATLTIIANNASWHAVRAATLHVYPDGQAASANQMPLTELMPSPAYEKTIETVGGMGRRVEHPDQLMGALEEALAAVRSGTPALVNVITQARA